MSRSITIIAILIVSGACALTEHADLSDVEKARRRGAKAQVTFRVIDSTGKPVEKANIRATFIMSDAPDDYTVVKGQTDADGLFAAAGKSVDGMVYDVTKDGSYKTFAKYWFYRPNEDCVRDGRWLPWNPTLTVVLKERRHPIPLYVKRVDVRIPAMNQPLGFDLEKGDWVAPHGEGTTPDLVFTYSSIREAPLVLSWRLDIGFSNPSDGAQVFPHDMSSELQSLYEAPEAGYAPALVDEYAQAGDKIVTENRLRSGAYLVFRVRSVMDDQGRLVRANYGKIYGSSGSRPFDYTRAKEGDSLKFIYYFNPTPNDRNLEFDPKKNLFGRGEAYRIPTP